MVLKKSTQYGKSYSLFDYPGSSLNNLGRVSVTLIINVITVRHCVKSVPIWNYSGPNAGKYRPE